MKLITRVGRRPIVIQLVSTGVSPTSRVWAGDFRDRPGQVLVSGPDVVGLASLLTTMASGSGARRGLLTAVPGGSPMTDERAVRMALEYADLANAVRRHIQIEEHPPECSCGLCTALAAHDRRHPAPPPEGLT